MRSRSPTSRRHCSTSPARRHSGPLTASACWLRRRRRTARSTPRPTTRDWPAGARCGRSSRAGGSWWPSSSPEVYDLDADPAETRNLAGERASMAAAMERRAREIEGAGRHAVATPTSDAQDRLRSLGYVASAPAPATPAAQASPNPAREIAAWGEFEDALSQVSAGNTVAALPRLRSLASRYPAAQVFQQTYAQALLDAGRPEAALVAFRGMVAQWPGQAALFHDLAVAAREAKQPARSPSGGDGRARARPGVSRSAQRPRPDPRRRGTRRGGGRGVRARDRPREQQPVCTGRTSATRGVNWAGRATRPAHAPPTSARWPSTRRGPTPPTASVSCSCRPTVRRTRSHGSRRRSARSPDFWQARLNLGIACQKAGQIDRARAAYRAVLGAPASFKREREAAAALLQGIGR